MKWATVIAGLVLKAMTPALGSKRKPGAHVTAPKLDNESQAPATIAPPEVRGPKLPGYVDPHEHAIWTGRKRPRKN